MVLMGYLSSAMERGRAVEREAAALVEMHGDDAGLIAGHLAAHPELNMATRRRWRGLARAIGRLRKPSRELRGAASVW